MMKPMLSAVAVLFLPALGFTMDLSAQSAIIVDASSGKVLYEKNADTPRFPASTTKIMTGMLLLEHCLPSDTLTAPAGVDKIPESSMHLKPGEVVTAKDMLYALLLRSANDAAVTIAVNISGSIPAFADLMNARAKQIGCTNTHFHNPNGLTDDQHTISARDLSMIAREAMKYEAFRDVVKTRKHVISRSINQADLHMVSKNRWLSMDPTADGIKTGYTKAAGNCYVGSATRNGFRVITVILKSDNWIDDHRQLLNYAFGNYERFMAIRKGVEVAKLGVVGGAFPTVDAVPGNDALVVTKKLKPGACDVTEEQASFEAPIRKGQFLTNMVLRDSDGFEQKVPLYAKEDVAASKVAFLGNAVSGTNGWLAAMGSLVFVGAIYIRGRKKIPYGPKRKTISF